MAAAHPFLPKNYMLQLVRLFRNLRFALEDDLALTLNNGRLSPTASQEAVIATLTLTASVEVPKGQDDSFKADQPLGYEIVKSAKGISLQLKKS
jgi:hypothetical protein